MARRIPITLSLDSEDGERLRDVAQANGVSASGLVRLAVRRLLAEPVLMVPPRRSETTQEHADGNAPANAMPLAV